MSLVALDLYAESSMSVCDVECAHGLRTFRLRHVTHDRGFGVGAPPAEGPLTLPLALWPGLQTWRQRCLLIFGKCQRRAG
jgi:hypothetical protein